MKEMTITTIFLVLCGICVGQTLGEFFNQRSTEIKYMKAQIAALAAYEKLLAIGYRIGQDSLAMITNIDQSDLNMHAAQIASLDSVKPVIRDDPRVKAAYDLSRRIKKMGAQIVALSEAKGWPFAHVADSINNACNQTEDCLAEVTENGALRMSDAERLERIDLVYRSLKELYLVAREAVREIRAAPKNGI